MQWSWPVALIPMPRQPEPVRVRVHVTLVIVMLMLAHQAWTSYGLMQSLAIVAFYMSLFLVVLLHELGHIIVAQFHASTHGT